MSSTRVGNVKKYKATFMDEAGAVAAPTTVRLELTPPGATSPTIYPVGSPQLQAATPIGTYLVRFKLEVVGPYMAVVFGETAALDGVTAADGVRVVATAE